MQQGPKYQTTGHFKHTERIHWWLYSDWLRPWNKWINTIHRNTMGVLPCKLSNAVATDFDSDQSPNFVWQRYLQWSASGKTAGNQLTETYTSWNIWSVAIMFYNAHYIIIISMTFLRQKYSFLNISHTKNRSNYCERLHFQDTSFREFSVFVLFRYFLFSWVQIKHFQTFQQIFKRDLKLTRLLYQKLMLK